MDGEEGMGKKDGREKGEQVRAGEYVKKHDGQPLTFFVPPRVISF
jgi:hypothetical protein